MKDRYKWLLIIFLSASLLVVAALQVRHHLYLKRVAAVKPLVLQAAKAHDVDPDLLLALIRQESNFDSEARGAAGERGLMQIMPGAVKDWEYHNKQTLSSLDELFDPAVNLEVGTWYLARALRQFDHHNESVVLALCQYNAGRSRALAWEKEYKENIILHIPYSSTRHYIRSILDYQSQYKR